MRVSAVSISDLPLRWLAACCVLSLPLSSQDRVTPAPVSPEVPYGVDEFPPGYTLIDGDILVPESALVSDGTFSVNFWPGRVYYTFHSNVSATNRDRAISAMRLWENVCNVRFMPFDGTTVN